MGTSNFLKFFENKIVQVIIAVLIPNLGGAIIFGILGAKFEENEKKYPIEPVYAPPSYVSFWIFSFVALKIILDRFFFKVVWIAWTIIFTLTGIASWRVYNEGKYKNINVKIPLLIYAITILLNWTWVVIAFGFGNLIGAIIEMIILLAFVGFTGFLFFKVDKISGVPFIIYFGYLFYATVVCIHIYILNN